MAARLEWRRGEATKWCVFSFHAVVILALCGTAVGTLNNIAVASPANDTSTALVPLGDQGKDGYDPCCVYPCLNQGICQSWPENRYTCDCKGTGYGGTNCEIRSAIQNGKRDPVALYKFLTSHDLFWSIVNKSPLLHSYFMKNVYLNAQDFVDSPPVYESDHSYVTLNAYFDQRYYARALPPVPENCPTPMGVKGPKEYPDVDELMQKVFLRKEFIPEPHDTNLLFQYYAQHFTHQFFRTDPKNPKFTLGTGGVDGSNVYGLNEEERQALRSGVNGKLRTQVLDGEDFPPYLKDVPTIHMEYPQNTPEKNKFALGNPFFSLVPGLFAYATIWLREHNRVCDVLLEIHPDWSDEQLYQTARLIIIGETIKITIEDYVQHLSQYKIRLTFEPELLHSGSRFQYHNRIQLEFNHLYHWHPMVANELAVNGTNYTLEEIMYSVDPIFNHSLDEFIHSLITSRAGALTIRNHHLALFPSLRKVLMSGRQLRIQGFNAYRRKTGAKPFTSFEDLTGETEVAAELEKLYGDVEAVEYYVGVLAERPSKSVTPLTMVSMGGPWSLKGLMANPICSIKYWKPSTFGGPEGMAIVKTASLEKLFCLNMKTRCENIGFKIPQVTP